MDMSNIKTNVQLKEKLQVLDTLICSYCKYYLNIVPLMSFLDGSTMCGRCYNPTNYENVPSNQKPTRNIALETIAGLLPFPCIYRDIGCTIRNVTKNYVNHEAVCRYRPFVCPFEDCTWSGLVEDIKAHFESSHTEYVLSSEITINTNTDYLEHYLIFNENKEILFLCKYDSAKNKYFCDSVYVTHSPFCGESIMELEFKTDNDTRLTFKKPVSNTFRAIDENVALQFDVQSLKMLLNTDCLKANIKISSVYKENDMVSNSKLWNELKCTVCLQLFYPPVLLCANGHSICNSCKCKLTTCPVCRVPYENEVHNIALEKLIGEMIYPCKNYVSGCGFIAPTAQIAEHESGCEFNFLVGG